MMFYVIIFFRISFFLRICSSNSITKEATQQCIECRTSFSIHFLPLKILLLYNISTWQLHLNSKWMRGCRRTRLLFHFYYREKNQNDLTDFRTDYFVMHECVILNHFSIKFQKFYDDIIFSKTIECIFFFLERL